VNPIRRAFLKLLAVLPVAGLPAIASGNARKTDSKPPIFRFSRYGEFPEDDPRSWYGGVQCRVRDLVKGDTFNAWGPTTYQGYCTYGYEALDNPYVGPDGWQIRVKLGWDPDAPTNCTPSDRETIRTTWYGIPPKTEMFVESIDPLPKPISERVLSDPKYNDYLAWLGKCRGLHS
jgi:hypothetical protein